jgi:hypothetical protein
MERRFTEIGWVARIARNPGKDTEIRDMWERDLEDRMLSMVEAQVGEGKGKIADGSGCRRY